MDDDGGTPGEIEVIRRDDDTWDVVRDGEVLSSYPLRAMAESERYRLAQGESESETPGPYPDNVGG